MGMYDNLKISAKKLPLSKEEQTTLGDNHDWQTKDFDCTLSDFEITDDGKLRFLNIRYEWDENAKSAMFEFTGKYGSLVVKDKKWEYIEYHGYVNFYRSINDVWYEFNAKFTDGKLVNIERV